MQADKADMQVSTEWLDGHLTDPKVRVIDATHFLATSERNALSEYQLRHIPGAVYFDIDSICDQDSPFPHMIPTVEIFAEAVGALGIENGHSVIVYDSNGNYSAAARVWWMFSLFGHTDVRLLEGGLRRWLRERRRLQVGEFSFPPTHYKAEFETSLHRTARQVMDNLSTGEEQVIDCRSRRRFEGVGREPQPTKRKGRIPGSINIPFTELIDIRNDCVFLPADRLIAKFTEAGVNLDKPVITSCGSGMTAALTVFALNLIGHGHASVFDGSWVEWGNRTDTPIEGEVEGEWVNAL